MELVLSWLRQDGWSVGVHNDYALNGVFMTFWLFTNPSGHYVKGEGQTDVEALKICLKQARALDKDVV